MKERRARGFSLPLEVIQSSAMDCGPAALKSLLASSGVHVDYDRVREACNTDLDGTSITSLETVAHRLGVGCAQHMMPRDALAEIAAHAPLLMVTHTPAGGGHFVVVGSSVAGYMQVMDPRVGRRWLRPEQFDLEVFVHSITLGANDWLEFCREGPFFDWLIARLQRVGLRSRARDFVEKIVSVRGWRGLAAIDAAARVVDGAMRVRGGPQGGDAVVIFERCLDLALADVDGGTSVLPAGYWFARPAAAAASGDERVTMQGIVLLVPDGRVVAPRSAAAVAFHRRLTTTSTGEAAGRRQRFVVRELADFLERSDGVAAGVVVVGVLLGVGGALAELMVFRAAFSLVDRLGLVHQRLAAGLGLVVFLAALLGVELLVARAIRRLGRHVEGRLRVATLTKIPRLLDSYLQSRAVSDLAYRAHNVFRVREAPFVAYRALRASLDLVITVVAICWLQPSVAPVVVGGAVASLLLPVALGRLHAEHDMRMVTQSASITNIYLDALAGLVPVRTHGAEGALAREHEGLMVDWLRSAMNRQRVLVSMVSVESLFGVLVPIAAVAWSARAGAEPQGLLLLLFWAQRIPAIGATLVASINAYAPVRNELLRILEPLRAAEQVVVEGPRGGEDEAAGGVDIRAEGLRVGAGGQVILDDISVHVAAGEHVAVVGRSGAGKSSLVGLLLGWLRASRGALLVDGEPLDDARLARLRRETAWVDPAVQLWNDTLLANVQYGTSGGAQRPMAQVVTQADLIDVLDRLPEGLQTRLGAGGGLVSGGEGQRVRLARALVRGDARLVILDEPFRGLDRERRRLLLRRARELWASATLICVTHDVVETRGFARVLVVDEGRIVEDDTPEALMARRSHYRELLEADARLLSTLWSSDVWRRVVVRAGRVVERARPIEEGRDGET